MTSRPRMIASWRFVRHAALMFHSEGHFDDECDMANLDLMEARCGQSVVLWSLVFEFMGCCCCCSSVLRFSFWFSQRIFAFLNRIEWLEKGNEFPIQVV